MKRLLTLAALLCVVAPTALAAPPTAQSKACKAQRNAIGMNAFRLLYAPTASPKAAKSTAGPMTLTSAAYRWRGGASWAEWLVACVAWPCTTA